MTSAPHPPRRHLIAALLVALVAAASLTACGGSGDDSSSDTTSTPTPTSPTTTKEDGGGSDKTAAAGKQVFSDNCAGCHTLADAGASGSSGPNLDDLKPDEAEVSSQVENGGSGMPAFKDQLSPQQIDDVSAYVASVAGK